MGVCLVNLSWLANLTHVVYRYVKLWAGLNYQRLRYSVNRPELVYLQPNLRLLMTMSSFLMNPAAYTEPKFPPSEDYSQSNYMTPQNTDYYRHNIHNFGYGPADYRRYDIEEKYSPNSAYNQTAVTCSSDSVNKRLSQHHTHHPHPVQQQQSPPQAHVQSPNSTNTGNNTSVINTNGSNNNSNRVNGFTPSSSGTEPESPDASGSPQSVPSPGSQGSPDSACSKEQQGGQPVIYPWMRKSQSGNNSSGNSGM